MLQKLLVLLQSNRNLLETNILRFYFNHSGLYIASDFRLYRASNFDNSVAFLDYERESKTLNKNSRSHFYNRMRFTKLTKSVVAVDAVDRDRNRNRDVAVHGYRNRNLGFD